MERGLGGALMPDMQERIKGLRDATQAVEEAQRVLFEKMHDAHDAGMSLRVIGHNVGVNHERVRRCLADVMEIKPF